MTAKSLKEDVLKGLKIGVDDYLTKPFDSEVLLAKVKAILNRAAASTKNVDLEEYQFTIGTFAFNSKLRFLTHQDKEQVKLSQEINSAFIALHINDLMPRGNHSE